jgi:hypothetical protein
LDRYLRNPNCTKAHSDRLEIIGQTGPRPDWFGRGVPAVGAREARQEKNSPLFRQSTFLFFIVHDTADVGETSSTFRMEEWTLAGSLLFFGNNPLKYGGLPFAFKNIFSDVIFTVIEAVANSFHKCSLAGWPEDHPLIFRRPFQPDMTTG